MRVYSVHVVFFSLSTWPNYRSQKKSAASSSQLKPVNWSNPNADMGQLWPLWGWLRWRLQQDVVFDGDLPWLNTWPQQGQHRRVHLPRGLWQDNSTKLQPAARMIMMTSVWNTCRVSHEQCTVRLIEKWTHHVVQDWSEHQHHSEWAAREHQAGCFFALPLRRWDWTGSWCRYPMLLNYLTSPHVLAMHSGRSILH